MKAKSAKDSARVRQTKLVGIQKSENEALNSMAEWSPPTESLSRPGSGRYIMFLLVHMNVSLGMVPSNILFERMENS